MIITRDDIDGISDLKASLQHTFEMKDLYSLSYFLGLEVISIDDGIYLSQAKYASDLLIRAEITDSHPESTHLEPNVQFTPMDGTEYRALAETTAEVISTRWLLEHLGAPQSSPTDFFVTTAVLVKLLIMIWMYLEMAMDRNSMEEETPRPLPIPD
ncbi:uncharacterized protein LOC107636124 [Arachis ipaensis]|uniref:uncharacterized protein LOC107636124 n=1 Tax=Arachis ipaensis TaxID=130454 RepID=UPI0007AFD8D6|nr:uncharacterized protein LOC107636124 [Arachis ipaensis]